MLDTENNSRVVIETTADLHKSTLTLRSNTLFSLPFFLTEAAHG